MLDKTLDEIAQFLREHDTAQLALSSPDGHWASVVHFESAGLNLYLIEPQAGDLVFYLENDPQVVLCIDPTRAGAEQLQQPIAQIFGTGRVLAPHELSDLPKVVREAYDLKNGRFPGVYVVIQVIPRQIYRITSSRVVAHRETIDYERLSGIDSALQCET